jgi:hypothetical protein
MIFVRKITKNNKVPSVMGYIMTLMISSLLIESDGNVQSYCYEKFISKNFPHFVSECEGRHTQRFLIETASNKV